MADQYGIDLEAFSLARFRDSLERGEVLPGRQVLKEEIPERFAVLESMGIDNLKALIDALKAKRRVETFSQASGLPMDYLVILRREANSYVPKPVGLGSFPGIDPGNVENLAALSIKHSKHLFERGRTKGDRVELSRLAKVPGDDLLELVKLSDLARVSGVGPVFARLLFEAEASTVEELAACTPEALSERLVAIVLEMGYTEAMVPLKDVKHCINAARSLPKVIEY